MLSFYKKEVKAHDYNAHDNRLLNAPPEARSSGEDKRLHRAFVNYSGGKCACRVQFPFCCLQAVLSDDQTLPVWARKSDTPSVMHLYNASKHAVKMNTILLLTTASLLCYQQYKWQLGSSN